MKYNINDRITLYPTESGWRKIVELYDENYCIGYFNRCCEDKIGEDDSFTEQLWVVIEILHPMFYNGQRYFRNSYWFLNNA